MVDYYFIMLAHKRHAEIDWSADHVERARIDGMFSYEKQRWQAGDKYVAGIDEAGRGPLAGPVVAAAVMYEGNPEIPYIDDSKQLSPEFRELLFDKITNSAVSYGIAVVQVEEIDRINIYQAAFLAMRRALRKLYPAPHHVLVDGHVFPECEFKATTIIRGDRRSYSIASASILAKVHRDRLMSEYHQSFPEYGFANHKGYATVEHLNAIETYGYCPIHRRSFHPKRFQLNLDLGC